MESSDGDKPTATDATESVLGLDCDEETLSERESVGARRGPDLANGVGNEAPSSSSSAGSKRTHISLGSNQVEHNEPGVSTSSSGDSTWSMDGLDDHHLLSRIKDDHSERSVTSAGAAGIRQPRGVLRLKKLAQNASTDGWSGSRNIPLSNGVPMSTQLLRNRRGKSSALKENRVGGDDTVRCLKTENASRDQDSSTIFCAETEFSVEKQTHLSGEASKAVQTDNESSRHVNSNDDVTLEENAARMLCSLSDNRCVGQAKKNMKSLDRSKKPFLHHSNYLKNSCKEIKDVAGPSRLLRKRDDKVPFRKRRPRRHFYEVSPHDVDPFCIVKERIRVFWPLDETWYFGLVKEYDPVTRLHHVRYDDKDEEWINLQNERIKLLLLPGEAHSRSNRNNSRSVFKTKHEEREREDSDGSNAGSSETEPISSCPPRPDQGRSAMSSNISKQDETHSNIPPLFGQKCQEPDVKGGKMFNDVMRDSSPANRGAEVLNNVRTTPGDMRFRFVYSRKRFRRKKNGFHNISGQESCSKIVANPAIVLSALPGKVSRTRVDASLPYVSLVLNLPLKPLYNLICEACSIWLSNAFFHLQHGTLVALPVVHLDILFVDNVLGLKHLLLETCLGSAVSFFCLLVGSFNQCSRQSYLKDSKIPCTSIRFQISGVHGKSQVVFMLFSFIATGRSKWKQLLGKLRGHCLTRELSYANSNYRNIMHCTNGTGRRVLPSIDVFSKGLDLWVTQFLKGSNCSDISPVIWYFYERCEFVQNDLDMAAVPSLLLCHHLKLLTDGNLTNGSQQSISFTLDKDKQQSEEQSTSDPFHPFCSASGICPLNLSSSPVGLLDISTFSKNFSSSASWKFNAAETTLSSERYDSSIDDANPTCRKFPAQNGPYFGTDKPCSSKLSVIYSSQKSGDRCLSINIPPDKTADTSNNKSPNKDENDVQPISSLVQELNEYPIGRSTPTAPRTTYHRNRFTSISRTFGDGSKLLPEELTLTGFTGSSKRLRSQVSYSVSPRSEEFGLKHKSHFRKIQSHSAAKTNDSKRYPDNSRSGHSSPELLTCVANVLVTVGDRGWREYDMQITMDSDRQGERRICVKLAEGTKYVHKVCQVLQPGATNRYTHAMIWKGGADWCLEFPDRSQWSIFKQMHDECYSHNIRAASVKNIPIPGVCLVEDDENVTVSFVRTQDYIVHIGTDVEIALDDSRVIYDMDSDDESWISSWRKSFGENFNTCKLTDDLFERAMDKLEKFAYSHNCNELTIDQLNELDIDNVSLDIIKTIHAYWKDKRQKKGIPLIRHFQSAMWKIYEQQLRDWESTVYRMQGSNGYQENKLPPKPALFAFCLRPRGLQIQNKGPKQRSHKKLMSSGCHGFSREQESFYRAGRRCNEYVGDGRTCELYDNGSLYSPTGYSPRFSVRTDSPRSFDASERSSTPRYFRTNTSKRSASFAFSEDHQPSPSFRHQKAKRGAPDHWNNAIQEWQNTKHLFPGASQSHRVDIEELKLRDATSAAQHAATMAKLKREKAHCLMHKADLALHKATVALMISDAMKSSRDGRRDFRDDER